MLFAFAESWLSARVVSLAPCSPSTQLADCGPIHICAPWPKGTDGNLCRPCVDDSECEGGPEMECHIDVAHEWAFATSHGLPPLSEAVCAHKSLLPLDLHDTVGFSLTIVASALASGSGIGGGGLLIPLLILVFGFPERRATPLSNVVILGGAVANLGFNLCKPHPSRRKPLIAFEVALMMEPMTMLGALVGTTLNKIFPSWLTTLMLVLLLSFTARRTWAKGRERWDKERARLRCAADESQQSGLLAAEQSSAASERSSVLNLAGAAAAGADLRTASLDEEEAEAAARRRSGQLEALMRAERRLRHYARDVFPLLVLLVACFALSLLRGTSRSHSLLDVSCGSPAYLALWAAQLLLLVAASLAIRAALMRRHARRREIGYPFLPDDVEWTVSNTTLYPLLCVGAGLCAGAPPARRRAVRAASMTCPTAESSVGMFGIGGGIVKGPLMLEMGMLPAVSSATASFMILFTSATAALNFALFGALDPQYAGVLFCAGLAGTCAGQLGLDWLLRRLGASQSLIVLLIAVVIGLSAAMMGVVGTIAVVEEVRHGVPQGFHSICATEASGGDRYIE